MVRLNIIVEGETEEEFVNQILAYHLGYYDVYTSVHRVTTNRSNKKKQRGGLTNYLHIKNDIESWSKLEKIGLAKIREKCPHFNQWITQLENLRI